ncbi:PAS domain S-box protein [Curvivirga sp.]|uniref:hybrid sensor histidine kinase/response regulator n=1 Tax=Curvivirga sp. TaxID=2856848 RepID=UPI003B58E611
MIPSIRITTFGWLLSLGLLIAVISVATISIRSVKQADDIQAIWMEFEETAARKSLLLGQLRGLMGFNGMIHHFKNFLLRKDRYYLVAANEKLLQLDLVLTTYKSLKLSNDERHALTNLKRIIDQYHSNISLVEQLIEEEKTIEYIDAIVRIDDTEAIKSIEVLESQLMNLYKRNTLSITKSVADSIFVNKVYGIALVLILILLFIFTTSFIYWYLFRPLREVIQTLQTSRPDDPEDIRLKRRTRLEETEIGALVDAGNNFLEAVRFHSIRRKIAENTIRDREANLRAVLDNAVDSIITIDDHGIIQSVNKAATNLFQYTGEELIDNNVSMLMPEPDRSHHDAYLAQYRLSRKAKIVGIGREVTGLKRDGTEFPMQLAVSEVETSYGTIYTGIVRDLTEERENELRLLLAKEEAEKANRAKSEFLSSMSHELRTPLNAIIGFSQLLGSSRRSSLDERQEKQVSQIHSAGSHLLELIDEILDLAKIEAGQLSISMEPISLNETIEECIQFATRNAEEKDIYLNNKLCAKTLPFLKADKLRYKQAMINLLSNAIKYTDRGGQVTISGQITEEYNYRVSVADNGRGIPIEKQNELFQPFNRLGIDKSGIEGTGIGLALTKKIVELMDGSIGFESQIHIGSTFWVEFPIIADPINIHTDDREHIPNMSLPDGDHILLYIEDNLTNLQLMEDIAVEIPNLKIKSAITAEAGIELATQCHPNIILMDINLPGMSGIEATRILKATDATKDIPIIALSADASTKVIREAKNAGCVDYLTKPFNVITLMQLIEKQLKLSVKETS